MFHRLAEVSFVVSDTLADKRYLKLKGSHRNLREVTKTRRVTIRKRVFESVTFPEKDLPHAGVGVVGFLPHGPEGAGLRDPLHLLLSQLEAEEAADVTDAQGQVLQDGTQRGRRQWGGGHTHTLLLKVFSVNSLEPKPTTPDNRKSPL